MPAKSVSPKKDPRVLTIESWPVERPIPYARNPRDIPEGAIAKVSGSIKEFGFRSPILVDGEGVIIAGHTRLLAAQRLKLAQVPVVVCHGLTPAQVKAYRIADNRTAQEASWDLEMLNIELKDLTGLDIDLSLTGLDPIELTSFLGKAADHDAEWDGMPDFEQEDAKGAYHVIVHFVTDQDADDFFALIERPKKSSMWWPEDRQGLEMGACFEQWVAEDE